MKTSQTRIRIRRGGARRDQAGSSGESRGRYRRTNAVAAVSQRSYSLIVVMDLARSAASTSAPLLERLLARRAADVSLDSLRVSGGGGDSGPVFLYRRQNARSSANARRGASPTRYRRSSVRQISSEMK